MLPQLIAFALIAFVVWYGYRALKRELSKIQARKPKPEKKVVLKQDKDGVYRPESEE